MWRFLTLACAAAALKAAAAQPDLVLHATITRADYQTYKYLPFRVPAGAKRVTVEFTYTTRDQRTTIDIGLFDTERFRGWSGGNKSSFSLSETDATPSYLPGPLPAGEWKLVLGVPNIRPGVQAEFSANIFFGSSAEPEPLNAQARWYRGDLHMHTGHSDGSCQSQNGKRVPCPVFKTLEAAVARGLDFAAVTDHNTTSQYDAIRELQPYFDRLLLIPGREITTFQGHANVFGSIDFIDFRLGSQTVPSVSSLLDEIKDAGAIVSINHPMAPSGEDCMGCGWTASGTDVSRVQAIEAVNGGVTDGKYSGIPFWESLLNRGLRPTAIGGSDNHNATKPLEEPGSIGYPTTVVRAGELSAAAIINAIRAGHVFIDTQGSKNRLLETTARVGGVSASMGGSLRAPAGTSVEIAVHAVHVPAARIELIEDARVQQTLATTDEDEVKTVPILSDGKKHWVRAQVVSNSGQLLLLGNPVYLNY